jgi:hypothetical protein
MLKTISRRHRLLVVFAVAVVLGAGTYAFTAANTVPNTNAGSGSGTISGYTISNVQYQLEAANPANIDSVTFTLNANATVAKAKVVAASATYTDCTIAGGVNVTCDFSPNPTVLSADELSVIAHS